jgi:hypothetical protein
MIFFVFLQNNLGESAKVCKEGCTGIGGYCAQGSRFALLSHIVIMEGSFKGRFKVQIVMCLQQEARKQLWIGAQG